MELEGSLPCSKESTTGPYRESDESSQYHPIQSYIPYFEEIKLYLRAHLAVCVFVCKVKVKVKFSPLQALEALRVVRG
jgi:hypothetical protein